MSSKLTLISHILCPYVQRAIIALKEKQIEFDRIDIDLANKPEWFLKISPLGKTPVLLVDDQPIFESAVICEYLEDTQAPYLHPTHPLARASHRSWIEFASALLNDIGALYNAKDSKTLDLKVTELKNKLHQLEIHISQSGHSGPFFDGEKFSLVDAAFAPAFRYFDVFETIEDFDLFVNTPRVREWRKSLFNRLSVKQAVHADYPQMLNTFLLKRESELSRRIMKSQEEQSQS